MQIEWVMLPKRWYRRIAEFRKTHGVRMCHIYHATAHGKGFHDALGSGVAVCVAPLRRGGSAPRRRPGDWHPSGGLLTVGGAQTVAPKA